MRDGIRREVVETLLGITRQALAASPWALVLVAVWVVEATPQTIADPFDDSYSFVNLGPIAMVPTNYGGLTFHQNDPDTLLIGGAANGASGAIFSIALTRDGSGRVTGFSGNATQFASAPFIDGGLTYGPGGVLFYSRYPSNEIGQILPASATTNKVVALTPLGVSTSVGAAAFVPPGFAGAGQLKVASYNAGTWYTLTLSPDGSGTYNIGSATLNATTTGGPEGLIYVPLGSPQFTAPSVLVAEYSSGRVSAYEIDSGGSPLPATRRDFITGLSGAEGAVIDPRTNDFLFSTFGGGSRVIVVRGFAVPSTPTHTSTLTPTHTPTRTPTQAPSNTATRTATSPAVATTTPTAPPTGTETPTPTRTNSATATPTATNPPTLTPTRTASSSATPSPTSTRVSSSTATSDPTRTNSPTASATPVLTVTATGTATPSRTASTTATTAPSATPSATATMVSSPTATPDGITIIGTVLIAGPGGLRVGANLPVDVFICENRDTCLASPGPALGTVRTDANGRFTLRIPTEVFERRVLLVSQVFVGGVRCRALFTSRALSAFPRASVARVAGGAQEPLSIDPITEASVRLLEAAGLQRYSDDGIDAVIAAVQTANADTDFAGLDGEEANDTAEAVAANDPNVQRALQENAACVGDCNGDRVVAINELVLGVNIAVGARAVQDCAVFDADDSGTVLVNELVQGVNNALRGCDSAQP